MISLFHILTVYWDNSLWEGLEGILSEQTHTVHDSFLLNFLFKKVSSLLLLSSARLHGPRTCRAKD